VIELREYIDARGRNPYRKWVAELEIGTRARVIAGVLRLGDGNFSAVKSAGAGILELRMDFGPGYRVYFGKDGEQLVILLGGGSKRRQQKDIEAAKTLWSEYKRYKREG
jgi:putative addiction module killer protein